MSGVNKAILVGRVSSDPITRATQNGQVTNLTLVTNKKRGNEEFAEFHRLVFFNRLSQVIDQYIKKGSQLYCEGEIQTRSYEKEGIKRYSTEIIVNQMEMLGSAKANADGNTKPAGKPDAQASYQFEDEIPF